MADIALVFHWSPDVMKAMGFDELARWHALAGERLKLMLGMRL